MSQNTRLCSVSLTKYRQLLQENEKLTQDNKEMRKQYTNIKIEIEKSKVHEEIVPSKENENIPNFVGEIFRTIQKRYLKFQETGTRMTFTDDEMLFWLQIRTKAPSIYDFMIQQFGAPSDGHVRDAKYILMKQYQKQLKPETDIQNKQFNKELAKSLGIEWYIQSTKKYKSRFLIGEMLILKSIFIENQDATISQICQLFKEETQLAISVYTAKRILDGLNVGKNHVINKYFDDICGNIEFKW
ncbi:Hypothetical_protein [Hexamita inflata]|uniref:Hypothetical_protein n=1 Tax=Hexamita inflata TaxID=28002 RepID=A0ABP1JUA1_9EUKA